MRSLRDVEIPVRDGTLLRADLFLPDAAGAYPTLVGISPYGKEIQSLPVPPQPPTSPVYAREIEAGDPGFLTDHGYAQLIVDDRGIGRSGGTYRGWMSPQEAQDGFDVIEWAAAQEWSDGNIGMVGVSYYGTIQLAVAALQPPHLKAIMPFNAPADFYRESTHHGGILHIFFKALYQACVGGRLESEVVATSSAEELEGIIARLRDDPDLQQYPPLYNIAVNPERGPGFFDILAHPLDGPFYWERSAYRSYENIRIPFYAGSGWWAYAHMHLRGAFQNYTEIDAPKKLYIESRLEADAPMDAGYNAEVVRWYDHWLKGVATGIMDEPPIRVHVRGRGMVDEHEWPLARTEWTELFLHRLGRLGPDPEPVAGYPDRFTQQPIQEQPAVQRLEYATLPRSEDLLLIGPAACTLFAAIDAPDTHWIVAVLDLAPDGTAVDLTRGYLKASHREVDLARSTPWRPWHPHTRMQDIVPGVVYEYAIELSPLSTVIRAGHRLGVSISCLDHLYWPPPDPELGTGHQPWHVARHETVTHTVFHDLERPSRLLLPVIPGG
jgi:predicted acyl esterase